MPVEFVDLNSRLVAAVNCDNRRAMVKEKWYTTWLEKLKTDHIEFRKKTMTKWKSNLKSIKGLNISSY